MRITRSRVCLVGLICTVALAFVPLNAAEDVDADNQFLVVIYPVADLPVWSIEREGIDKVSFDPSLLKILITTTIDPESWQDETAVIKIHKTTDSFVIRQTQANHERVSELLMSLRRAIEHEDR